MIKVYTIENCFHCKDILIKLKNSGVEYTELDATEHIDYLSKFKQLFLPIIIKDDKLINIEDII